MKSYDVVVIGAGPAGIASTIYLQRSNLKVCLIERNAPGGRMLQAEKITNYPGISASGQDVAEAMFKMIDFAKIDFLVDEVTEIAKPDDFVVILKQDIIEAKKVILATGFINKPLANTNETQFIGKGISYCALCDAPLVKNQDILCFGNGLKTVKEVKYLAQFAKHIYFLTDSFIEDLPQNIEIINNAKINKFIGNFSLEAVELIKDDKFVNLNVSHAFIFNGFMPGSKLVEKLEITNRNGLIEVDEHLETKIKGLFAVGDINTKEVKQVATAVGDGAYVASRILR